MKCVICQENFDKNDLTEIFDVGFMCEDCMNSRDYHRCDNCGKIYCGSWTDLGEMVYICQECLDYSYIKCDRCGEYNCPDTVDYYELTDGSYICQSCYDPENDELARYEE